MLICGKALPPRAALLLTSDFLLFSLVLPLLLASSLLVLLPWAHPHASLALFARLAGAGLLCQVVYYYNDLYNLQTVRRPGRVLLGLFQATGMLLLLLGAVYAAWPRVSPGIDRILALLAMLFVTAGASRALALPRRREQVLVVGGTDQADAVADAIAACPEWNIRVRSRLSAPELCAYAAPPYPCNGIIVCGDGADLPLMHTLLDWKLRGLRVEAANSFYERALGRVSIDQLQPEWFVFSTGFANGERKRVLKRLFDLLAALLLGLAALPLLALVALAIKLERSGPVLFTQNRIGLHDRPFRIYKFRTMRPARPDADAGVRWVSEERSRITRLGGFLRTFRLDELPQLWNVLRGEMSLVGPRPEQPGFCALLAREIPYYRQRHTVPPGLTGWAQVRYRYGASVEESRRKLEFDLFYVKNLSLWLDLAVLLETVKVVLVGRGAR